MTLSILLNEARALKSTYVLIDNGTMYGFDEGLFVMSRSSKEMPIEGQFVFNVLDLFNTLKEKADAEALTIQTSEEHMILEADIRNLLFLYHDLRYRIDKIDYITTNIPIEYELQDMQLDEEFAVDLSTHPRDGIRPYRYHEAVLFVFKGLLPLLKADKLSIRIYSKYGYGNLVVYHIDKKPKRKKDPWWSIDVAMNCLFSGIE